MSLEQAIELNTLAIEKLTAALTSKLGEAAFSAADAVADAVADAAAAKPATKSRASKGTKVSAPAPADEFDDLEEAVAKAEDDLGLDDDDLGLDDEPAVPAVTKEILKAKFVELSKKKGGREAVQDLFKSVKATSFTDLKEADYAAIYAKVNKALA